MSRDELPGRGRMRHTTPEMRETARDLRQRATPAEQRLWSAIRGGQIDGLRFRRQHAVGTFVFDFFCSACGLVIELDGTIHDDPDVQEHDTLRQTTIENFGYRVLRIRNEEVLNDLPTALNRIRQATVNP